MQEMYNNAAKYVSQHKNMELSIFGGFWLWDDAITTDEIQVIFYILRAKLYTQLKIDRSRSNLEQQQIRLKEATSNYEKEREM